MIDYFKVVGKEFFGDGNDQFEFFKKLNKFYFLNKIVYFSLSSINIILSTPLILVNKMFFIFVLKLIIEHTPLICKGKTSRQKRKEYREKK